MQYFENPYAHLLSGNFGEMCIFLSLKMHAVPLSVTNPFSFKKQMKLIAASLLKSNRTSPAQQASGIRRGGYGRFKPAQPEKIVVEK